MIEEILNRLSSPTRSEQGKHSEHDDDDRGQFVTPIFEATERLTQRSKDIDEALVSDDEKVIRALAEVEGYAWQGDLANRLEWSEPKTSRTLQTMAADDRITRYKIGRRNVVCLPHREPEILREHVPVDEPP